MRRHARRALGSALLIVSLLAAGLPARADVVVPTQHNDNFRTGANLAETQLTPANVGRLQRVDRYVDGFINTQILYAHGVRTAAGPRNLAFVTTSSNSVYAFDADDRTSAPQGGLLWHTALTDPQHAVRPWARGINATPVLEFASGGGTIDVLYSTANQFPWNSFFVKDELALQKTLDVQYYLVKLDLATGHVVHPPVALRGSVKPAGAAALDFVPRNESDTASLLLDHGYIYASFSARQNENVSQYYGWMLRYRAADLSYAGAFNTVPHAWDWKGPAHPSPNPSAPPPLVCYDPVGGRLEPWGDWVANGGALTMACVGEGGGIWQGGAGPAADRDGNVYVMIGNGHYDTAEQSYGDSIVKLRSTADAFGVAASWAPNEQAADEQYDVDLGSAGPLLVDGRNSVVAGGKTGIFYVVSSELKPLQQVLAGVNNRVPGDPDKLRYQTWNQGPHLHGSPTLWRVSPRRGYVYEWAEKDYLKKYALDLTTGTFAVFDPKQPWIARADGPLAAPCNLNVLCLNAMPGGMLAISANGTTRGSGIVWAILTKYDPASKPAIYAFDADTLKELWHDPIGEVPHFAGPTVADGHVFVPTNSFWFRFSIYSLGAQPAQQRLTGPARPWLWKAQTAMEPMTAAVPDYALNPAYRARLALPGVMRGVPPGLIVHAAYAVAGTETYACAAHDASSCVWKRTELRHVHRYDDRVQLASAAEITLKGPRAYASRVAASRWPGAADWQLLRRPGGIFGDAAYVLRTRTSDGAPPADPKAGENAVAFTAVYLSLVPGH